MASRGGILSPAATWNLACKLSRYDSRSTKGAAHYKADVLPAMVAASALVAAATTGVIIALLLLSVLHAAQTGAQARLAPLEVTPRGKG